MYASSCPLQMILLSVSIYLNRFVTLLYPVEPIQISIKTQHYFTLIFIF